MRQEVINFERSIIVQELEFAIRSVMTLGNQYIVGSLSWCSSAFTANLSGISFEWLLTFHQWMSLRNPLYH